MAALFCLCWKASGNAVEAAGFHATPRDATLQKPVSGVITTEINTQTIFMGENTDGIRLLRAATPHSPMPSTFQSNQQQKC